MTTWNNTSPAVGNQISADIPDITENFAHLKSGFVRIFQDTWSDSDLSGFTLDSAVGFSNGTRTFDFPTNGVGQNAIIMCGNSSTIAWFYLNTAPPGWKVLSTGADSVLAISGGSAAYNVDGGNGGSGDTWTQPNHTHTGPSHNHKWYDRNATPTTHQSYDSGGSSVDFTIESTDSTGMTATSGTGSRLTKDFYTENEGTGNTGNGATANTWRPLASVGKLFQLDTA